MLFDLFPSSGIIYQMTELRNSWMRKREPRQPRCEEAEGATTGTGLEVT